MCLSSAVQDMQEQMNLLGFGDWLSLLDSCDKDEIQTWEECFNSRLKYLLQNTHVLKLFQLGYFSLYLKDIILHGDQLMWIWTSETKADIQVTDTTILRLLCGFESKWISCDAVPLSVFHNKHLVLCYNTRQVRMPDYLCLVFSHQQKWLVFVIGTIKCTISWCYKAKKWNELMIKSAASRKCWKYLIS